ncbi:hypothetical protein [Actinoplanes derwentensis]|uniref:DUF2567 domain-containing protein n=1 Tax=Actinoplanes derwentensis TaxID=113562 RepID=A0A1H2CRX8_9ACTN|nr:hypothetical protein [Actinoplanes derwentensis]GID85481.1 hypothetical protein Ade03nite_44050 [Actinoplanes derwentensis]SDT73285.1 hypothetical protein SAMN04489716_6620 [Actinoplanes derwentensis]
MSYAVQPTPVAVPSTAGRPAAVTTAVALLWAMAAAGLTYAISMIAVTPGVVSRFRDATSGSSAAENYITVIWLVGALAPVLALLFVALFVVLGAALRRGSRLARLISVGVCGLGLVTGFGTLGVLAAQRAGDAVAGSIGEALDQAYPSGWITLNFAVAIAQVVGYLVVGALLLAAPRDYFGAVPSFVPSSQFVASPSPSEWAAPQTKPFVTDEFEPDQFSDPAVLPKSAPGPEDEYWSRPGE